MLQQILLLYPTIKIEYTISTQNVMVLKVLHNIDKNFFPILDRLLAYLFKGCVYKCCWHYPFKFKAKTNGSLRFVNFIMFYFP